MRMNELPPSFVEAIRTAIKHCAADTAGFFCCWKLLLNGRWLKHSDNFPKWQFRLLRKGRARFKDFGHGQKEGKAAGRIEYLREPYIHEPFRRGWAHWEAKHRKYAKQEAAARAMGNVSLHGLLSKHATVRNPALKVLVTKIPGWPWLRFAYTYALRGGFLEGRDGFEYCWRMSWFEGLVQREIREIERNPK